MAEGYENFKDYLEKTYIEPHKHKFTKIPHSLNEPSHGEEAKSAVRALALRGIPKNLIANLFGVTERFVHTRTEDIEQTSSLRKEIIREWYSKNSCNQTSNHTPEGSITLDDYMSTYADYPVFNRPDHIIDMLFMLKHADFVFPYSPTPTDAYLFANNIGNGSLRPEFSFIFSAKGEDAKSLASILPIHNKEGNDGITFSSSVGRLYYILGTPMGDRIRQIHKVPSWVKGQDFEREFIAGIFDTVLKYSEKKYHMYVGFFANKQIEDSFRAFVENVEELIVGIGIEPTKKSVVIAPHSDELLRGFINLRFTDENIRRIGELPLRFARTKRIFKSS